MSRAAIWKFELVPMDNRIKMPLGSRILSVGVQGAALMMWAVVSPDLQESQRDIFVAMTGQQYTAGQVGGHFVGTLLHPTGLVFHVFDHGEVRQ